MSAPAYAREVMVHLIYVDDSAEELIGFQIIGAAIVPEDKFSAIEKGLALMIANMVPEELRDSFEFHASALYHAKKPFEDISRDQAIKIFEMCIRFANRVPIPIVYGAVDSRKLRSGRYATAQPVDIAFRICMEGINQWFNVQADQQMGIVICDEPANKNIKDNLRKAFRAYRRKLRYQESEHPDPNPSHVHSRIHDDMYFGDSAYSIGIQLADVYSYLILRHLAGKQDTEFLYKQIEQNIFYGEMEPPPDAEKELPEANG